TAAAGGTRSCRGGGTRIWLFTYRNRRKCQARQKAREPGEVRSSRRPRDHLEWPWSKAALVQGGVGQGEGPLGVRDWQVKCRRGDMGGSGSGRRRQYGPKGTTEGYRSIDVRQWKRGG